MKDLLLKSITYEWINLLSLMGRGDISQLSFGENFELCIHISRGKERTRKNPRDPLMSRINKSTVGTTSRDELGNFLD